MNESAQITETKKAESNEQSAPIVYDADAVQEWKYSLPVEDKFIDGIIKFSPLSDERYLSFLNEASKLDAEDKVENVKKAWEANQSLWKDLLISGAFEGISDWLNYLDFEDINTMLSRLTVLIIKSVTRNADGTMTVVTECYFNGKPCEQIHRVKKTIDSSSKYALLETKEFTREAGKGLDSSPILTYRPQDEEKGKIYDEILIESESKGFASWTPLRFKTLVVDRIHSTNIKPKK